MTFLKDRKMVLRYKGKESNIKYLSGGSPKVLLGLLSFFVYINDTGFSDQINNAGGILASTGCFRGNDIMLLHSGPTWEFQLTWNLEILWVGLQSGIIFYMITTHPPTNARSELDCKCYGQICAWMVFWRCLEWVWKVSWRCLEGVLKVLWRYVESVWKASQLHFEQVWKLSGRFLNIV